VTLTGSDGNSFTLISLYTNVVNVKLQDAGYFLAAIPYPPSCWSPNPKPQATMHRRFTSHYRKDDCQSGDRHDYG
jgi:hypothetical protein